MRRGAAGYGCQGVVVGGGGEGGLIGAYYSPRLYLSWDVVAFFFVCLGDNFLSHLFFSLSLWDIGCFVFIILLFLWAVSHAKDIISLLWAAGTGLSVREEVKGGGGHKDMDGGFLFLFLFFGRASLTELGWIDGMFSPLGKEDSRDVAHNSVSFTHHHRPLFSRTLAVVHNVVFSASIFSL